MTTEILELLKDLAFVLEKHKGGLAYTTADDGIHVTTGGDWNTRVCIGWPVNGDVSELRQIIQTHTAGIRHTKL